jgi:hypothetical protein
MWKFVTEISLRIGIVPSLAGGLGIMLLGFITPGILYGSILLALLGYALGAVLIVFGLMLFVRGVI